MREEYKFKYIPDNYETGVNIMGLNFKPRFLFEGIIVGLILFVGVFVVMLSIPLVQIGTKIGISVAIAAIGLVLGIKGINNEPLSIFIKNYFNFKKKRRSAFYNPRVKREAKPYDQMRNEKEESLPREKIMKFFNSQKEKNEKKNGSKVVAYENNNFFDAEKMYFSDDEGIIRKPEEYMDDKEIEIRNKERKKREKEVLEMAKLIEREERYKK